MQTRYRGYLSDLEDTHLISAVDILTQAITQSRNSSREKWRRISNGLQQIINRFTNDHIEVFQQSDFAFLDGIYTNGTTYEFTQLPPSVCIKLMSNSKFVFENLLHTTEDLSALKTYLLHYLADMPVLGSDYRTTWYLDTNPAFITGSNIRIATRFIPSHVIEEPLRAFYRGTYREWLEILTPNMILGFSGRTLIEAQGLSQSDIDQYHSFINNNNNQQPPTLLTSVDLRLLSDHPLIGQPGQINLMLTAGSYSIVMNENSYVAALLLLMTLGMIAISKRSTLFSMFAPKHPAAAQASQNDLTPPRKTNY